jgi:hypothetical protein
MTNNINPFHDLYLSEAIGSDKFVQLFSPMFVMHGLSLYQPGNVILKGLQGSGKTMLLNLLKAKVRVAYDKAELEFPVPREFRQFISAGINFRKSGVAEFAQILDENSTPRTVQEHVLHFGDFFNYWIVYDLLDSIEYLIENSSDELLAEIGLKKQALDQLAVNLSKEECWSGALEGVSLYSELKAKLSERIGVYRSYINFNIFELPESVKRSKTVIGEPIARAVDCLKDTELISKNVNVFVRIDQYEELTTLDFSGLHFGRQCQQLVHKALSARDSRVSYRIGTRHYSWPKAPLIFSTDGALENKRDFSFVDIDEKFRRTENSSWIFPEICTDIFRRRISSCQNAICCDDVEHPLQTVFGKTKTADEKAGLLVSSPTSRNRMVKAYEGWTDNWVKFLKEIAQENPLVAKYGMAWVHQQGKDKRLYIKAEHDSETLPWMERKKQYWRKERAEQALTQLASTNGQQLYWSGVDDILGLSGGNILIFLFICQHIWDAWLRTNRGESHTSGGLPEIDFKSQSIGILNASEEWLKKPFEGKDSSRRKAMIMLLGKRYYRHMTNDIAMSYPGWTGFSLPTDQLDRDLESIEFLETAVSFGDLYEFSHTSKKKGEKRKKFYLAPIFCPAFKITYKHIKEPEYIDMQTFSVWVSDLTKNSTIYKTSLYGLDEDTSPQGSLF